MLNEKVKIQSYLIAFRWALAVCLFVGCSSTSMPTDMDQEGQVESEPSEPIDPLSNWLGIYKGIGTMTHESGQYTQFPPRIRNTENIKFQEPVVVIIDSAGVRAEFSDSVSLFVGRTYPRIEDDTDDPNISSYFTSHLGRVYRKNFSIKQTKNDSTISGILVDGFGSPDQTTNYLNKTVTFRAQKVAR